MASESRKPKRKYGDNWKKLENKQAEVTAVYNKLLGKQPISPQIEPDRKIDQSGTDILSSQDKTVNDATTMSRQDISSSQDKLSELVPKTVQPSTDILSALPRVAGHLQIPNTILDCLFPILSTPEQAVYLHLFRLSHGFGNSTCNISLERLGQRAGMTGRNVQRVLAGLEQKGLVRRLGVVTGRGKAQGIIFSVANLSSQDIMSNQDKISRQDNLSANKDLKEKVKKNRRQLEQIISRVRSLHVGASNYSIADLAEDTKRACAREGVVFDNDLFNEITGAR